MAAPIILVVEDNSTARYVLAQLLESFDYAAHLVASGEEALAAVAVTKYACVLMDVTLPGIDGYETTRRIRKSELKSGRRTKVIAVTGRSDERDVEAAKSAGMDDFLNKPFESEELRAILLRHVYDSKYPNLKVLKPYKKKDKAN
jgi:two-component system, sensor histidine kinase